MTTSEWKDWKAKQKITDPLGYRKRINEQRIKEFEKKFNRLWSQDPQIFESIIKKNKQLHSDFDRLTRLTLWPALSHFCDRCLSIEDLEIHHKKYAFPPCLEDVVVFCKRHHIEEHQKTTHTG